jgi:hypothetical protein
MIYPRRGTLNLPTKRLVPLLPFYFQEFMMNEDELCSKKEEEKIPTWLKELNAQEEYEFLSYFHKEVLNN